MEKIKTELWKLYERAKGMDDVELAVSILDRVIQIEQRSGK